MKFIIFWRWKTPGWDWSITKLITSEFFIKWTHFFIKSTKIGIFYRYGYNEITTFWDPCAEPSHHIPYQRLAFFTSNATYPGMPEFAKSEFSVIRLHEVKTMRKIRKQQWENFFLKNIPHTLPVPRTSSGYMMWYKKIYNMRGSSFRQR